MSEVKYLKMFVEDHNKSVALEKEKQGKYTIEEILEAMNIIYQSIDKT
jgi:hypothetical protein